jgi:hypothetical protein
VSTARLDKGTTREHHVAADKRPQGRFGRPVGSADPLWALVAVCFLQAAVRWVLKAVPGAHVDWRQFGRVGGP